jgi:hypothetical protein
MNAESNRRGQSPLQMANAPSRRLKTSIKRLMRFVSACMVENALGPLTEQCHVEPTCCGCRTTTEQTVEVTY